MKNLYLLQENFSSENLWKKINLLSEDQIKILTKGLKWTVENLPASILIGGTATVHYVTNERKLTPDLDFMTSDIWSVKAKLNSDKIKFNDLNPGIEKPIGIVADEFNVDFLDCNVGNTMLNKLIAEKPNVATIGGYQVKIINAELLAIMKLELGRERDLDDAFALLQSGKCNKEKYTSYMNLLKEHLKDYDSIVGYQELIK